MFQYSDRFNIKILMFTNQISPYKSNAYHGYEPCNALHVSDMGGFDVKPRRLHGTEQSLNLPSFLISFYSLVWSVITNKDLKFWFKVGVKELCTSEIDILTFMDIELGIEKFLADTKTVEEMPCPYILPRSWIPYPEVLTYTDIISDVVLVEPANPVLSHELPVGHKAIDTITTEKPNEPFHECLAFLTIGIASLGHKFEKYGEGNPFVGDAQHKDIDVEFTELPVGTVHVQDKACLYGQEAEYHPCKEIKVKNELRKETLQSSHVGISADIRGHTCSKFMKTHGLDHTEGMNHESHQLDACKVDIISEMFFQDWQDLVNFERVLGVSKFHRKSG